MDVAASALRRDVPEYAGNAPTAPGQPYYLDLDSFPVGIVVRGLRIPLAIGFAAAYTLLATVLLLRLISRTRPTHTHRRGAYICFTVLSLCRIPMLVLGALVLYRMRDGTLSNWHFVMATDMLAIVGYGWFCAGIYALAYSWSGRVPCCLYLVQSDNSHPIKSIAVYMFPVISGAPCVAGSIVRLIGASPVDGNPDSNLFHKGVQLSQGGTIASFIFTACLVVIVLPYTAYRRCTTETNIQIDHAAVADIIRKRRIEEATKLTTWRAFGLLYCAGLCLVPGGLLRILLARSAQLHYPDHSQSAWMRTPLAFSLMIIMPELIALTFASVSDFNGLNEGNVHFWRGPCVLCKKKQSNIDRRASSFRSAGEDYSYNKASTEKAPVPVPVTYAIDFGSPTLDRGDEFGGGVNINDSSVHLVGGDRYSSYTISGVGRAY